MHQTILNRRLVAASVGMIGPVLFFIIVSKSLALLSTFADWIGLIQRIALVPFMVWLFLFALFLLKSNAEKRPLSFP